MKHWSEGESGDDMIGGFRFSFYKDLLVCVFPFHSAWMLCLCVTVCTHLIHILCIFISSDPVSECLTASLSTWEQWWWNPRHDGVVAQGCSSINSPKKTPFTWHQRKAGHTILLALLLSSFISSCPQSGWNFKNHLHSSINHCHIQFKTITSVNNQSQCWAERQPLTANILSGWIVS